MAKTLDEVRAAILALPDGADLWETISTVKLEAETHKKGFNSANSFRDKLTQSLKQFGYNGEDPAVFLETVKKKIDMTDKSEEKLTASEQRFVKLEKELSEMRDKSNRLETEKKHLVIREALMGKMKGKINAPDLRAKVLIQDGLVDVDSNGSIVWKNGQESIDLEKGLVTYYDQNKIDLINSQTGGAGSSGSGSASSVKQISRKDFDALPPEQRKDFLLKDKGEIVQ
jgi:hypothetical protein